MAGICGTGMKPDDLIGAWACSACHDEIDRRTHNLDNKDARLYHLEGVIRTQAILLKEGRLSHENLPNKIAVASFKQPILATLKRDPLHQRLGKRYRKEVIELIQQQQLDIKITPRIRITIHAAPPDNRKRDLDNLPKAVLTHSPVRASGWMTVR